MTAALAPSLPARTGPGLEDRPLSDREFQSIAALLYADSGIHLAEGKASLVHSRLSKRLRALGLESFGDYVELVSSVAGAEERRAMLSALTTNVTRFFREDHHFTDLAERLQGGWAEAARHGARIRFWSAACSSGEEPYTLALTVLGVLPEAASLDVRVLATDIDPLILEKAQRAVYSETSLAAVPDKLRQRWIKRDGDDFTLADEVKALVSFRELNLMAQWPMKGPFQAIFCRNVAIYFDAETQERLWSRYAPLLSNDGRLYIGHSERVGDPRFEPAGQTIYKLKGAAG
jgi:chemotaxis protein methyltransferase CheR